MKLLVLSTVLKQRHIDKIRETSDRYDLSVAFTDSEVNIPEGFEAPDIVYGFGTGIARRSRDLKWLCVPSAGVDYLMSPECFMNEDCILTNSSGSYGVTIAEHIIAVSLMMMRRLTYHFEETSQGTWGEERYLQRSLKDSRITVLGTGDIGIEFARRARAFEPLSIKGINRSGICDDPAFDSIDKIDSIDEILMSTDLLVMSLPSTPETVDILDRRRIGLLPDDAFVVNVGRGSAIDEEALADALDEGHIAGAALDVFKTEPLPSDSRLWNTKNLLITPHVAGNLTLEHTLDKNVDMFVEDLDNYMSGRPLRYIVDRKRGY